VRGLGLAFAVVLAPTVLATPTTPARTCAASPGRATAKFSGEVHEGKGFGRSFGPDFVFSLRPIEGAGWVIEIREKGRDEDISRLTTPFRGPNARYIEGWEFRNEGNTGPNNGSVNAPTELRRFFFSPEVGRTIDGPGVHLFVEPRDVTREMEEIGRVEASGRGELEIVDYRLADLAPGQRARMVWMRFRVCLSWPDAHAEPLQR
jgi:hypothetical protein